MYCVKAVRDLISHEQKAHPCICLAFSAFPRDPEIHLSGPLEAGKPITVKCLVADVYPFDRLEIDLTKGDRLMKSQEFLEDADRKSLETKSLEVTFTPVIEDIGKVLVCRAKLHIDEMDSVPTEREAVKELQVYSKYLCDVFQCLWESHLACV